MSIPQPRKKKPQDNAFTITNDCSALHLNANEKAERQEERRRFLALPVSEKTYQSTRVMSMLKKELLNEEKEEHHKLEEIRTQGKNKKVLPVQTPARQMLKIDMMKRRMEFKIKSCNDTFKLFFIVAENFKRESKHYLISLERQNAVLELSLMEKRAEIQKMDKVIGEEEKQLKELQQIIDIDNLQFNELLKENEKKSLEAKTHFEQQAQSNHDTNAELRKLSSKIGILKSEVEDCEQTLNDYRRYKGLLFKLSPPDWQEAKKAKVDCKVPSGGQKELDLSAAGQDKKTKKGGFHLPAIKGSTTNSSRILESASAMDSSEFEDEPELYFTDPQQLVEVVTEMTEQIPSLIHNTTRVEKILEDLRQATDTTRKKIEKKEEQLTWQISDMKQKIQKEKMRATKLKQKVDLHNSVNTQDQKDILVFLGEKVTEVYSVCVENRETGFSTLQKLANIEKYVTLLLQSLESIPEERLDTMRKIKESEQRIRQREEKLMEQKRKQKERMDRYLERSLADVKRTGGRKLMPRCIPVSQTVKLTKEENNPTESEIGTYLYSSLLE